MKKILLTIVLLCGIFVSCKKSTNTSTTCTLSSTSIIGNYKITAVSFLPAGSPIAINGLTYFPACDTDNVYELQTGGIGVIVDAGVQCSPPANATGIWSLSGTTLSTSLAATGQETISGVVSGFNCLGFILTSADTISGISGTATITFATQ